MSDKGKKAVALRYQIRQDNAPQVVAVGQGELARRIIKEAKRHGIPIYEDQELVNSLMQLPLNTEIPPELYRAVAEVLVFIYKLDKLDKKESNLSLKRETPAGKLEK